MIKGQIISGKFSDLIVRQRSSTSIEIGELLVAEQEGVLYLLQVTDLLYGSQISQQQLEMISGMQLEEGSSVELFEKELRTYNLAVLKSVLTISKGVQKSTKELPAHFTEVRAVKEEDLAFFQAPKHPLFLGCLRSGSKTLAVPLSLDALKVFSHHVLVTGTTGKGKSNLMYTLIWNMVEVDGVSLLVLDPHDEYYGRQGVGMKDHPRADRVVYYSTKNVPPGGVTLKIHLHGLRPEHFSFLDFSEAQRQAMEIAYKNHGKKWVEMIVLEQGDFREFKDATIKVLKRRLSWLLDLDGRDGQLFCSGVFDYAAGQNTISDICGLLEDGRSVIVDTSHFSGQIELLIGGLITSEVFRRYKRYKVSGELEGKPVVSVVLEEAPRVLGKEVLERGSNIFSTLSREGRKFKVGITAITQLPSLIPREILANINTKIILGTEMKQEREAIIESAAQDLSSDSRAIASLDIGEALVSSNFARFALPVSIPFFENVVKDAKKKDRQEALNFEGVRLS